MRTAISSGSRYVVSGVRAVMSGCKKDALLVFFLLASTYAYFYHDPRWNGNSRLGLTFALVEEGRLTIDSFHNREGTVTGDKSFSNGHYYSDKAIGTSVVGSVFYLPIYWLTQLLDQKLSLWVVKYLLTFFVIGLPSALAGSLMYVVCRSMTGSKLQAYAATLAITLGTMYLPFSSVFFGHQLAASLLFCAFFMVFQLKVDPGSSKIGSLFLIGLLLGLSLITEYTTALVVVPLGVYYFHAICKEQLFSRLTATILPALGGLIPVTILLIYNKLCFGDPLSLGYEHLSSRFFRDSMAQGFMGIRWPQPMVLYYLTVHPAHGLFWQSPVLIMSLFGAYFMFRAQQYRAEATIAITTFFSYLLINSGYYMWWGGWSFGPRHLIPMLPFLCLPLVFVPKRLFFLVVILGLVSVSQMLIVAASTLAVPDEIIQRIDALKYFQYSSIYSYCLPRLLRGQYGPNLGRQLFGLPNWTSLLPIMLVILSGTGMLFRGNFRRRCTP
jgi:hypothetical protein